MKRSKHRKQLLRPSRFVVMTLCSLTCLLLRPLPVVAQDGFTGLCPLFLQQMQTEREDLELAIQMDETLLDVAEEIFVLVDGLWQNDLFERLPYLGMKHRRDVAEISLERNRRRLGRQQTVVEQYSLACSAPSEQAQASDDRQALEEAHQRYIDADCEVRMLDVAMFEVDLEYHQELLKSALDLRQSDIASRQQVLFAERDVELTLKQLEQARQRTARCQIRTPERTEMPFHDGLGAQPARRSFFALFFLL